MALSINKMLNKPVIDSEFGEVLDNFLHQLNETQKYLSSGIFNVKFAEAGLFLQNSTAIYGKRVDLLWDSVVKFQMQLCSLNNSADVNSEETIRIKTRVHRSKREKIITDDFLPVPDSNDTINISDKFKILQCPSLQINKDFLSRWKIKTKKELKTKTTNDRFPNKIFTSAHFPVNSHIYEINSGEKLCNYKDMYLNSSVLNLFSNRCKEDSDCDKIGDFSHGDDWLLQRYLKERNLTYGQLWTDKLADNFDSFQKSCRKKVNREKEPVVNIQKLPEQLMTAYLEKNDLHMRTLVRDIMSIEKQKEGMKGQHFRDRSDRISLADSAFHEESFVSEDSPTYNRQSLSDSGVFCDLPSSAFSEYHESMFTSGNGENVEENHCIHNTNIQADMLSNCIEKSRTSPIAEINNVSERMKCESSNERPITETSGEISIKTSTCIRKVKKYDAVSDEEEDTAQIDRVYKRKLRSRHKLEKRRKVTFQWLKTTTAYLRKFENFFLKNYIPEAGEARENGTLPLMSSDDESIPKASSKEDGNVSGEESLLLSENELTDVQISEVSECSVANSGINGEQLKMNNENEQINETVDQEHITDQTSTTEFDNSINKYEKLAMESVKRLQSVLQWRKFIEPKLEALEKAPKFDIHEYGSHILNIIPIDENLRFENLVKDKSSSDVCRMFMATLQLTNTYNVDLIAGNQGELANNTLELKLLTKDRYHEHLDEYAAPSEHYFRERLQQIQSTNSMPLHSTPKLNRHQPKRQKLSYS